MISVFGNVATGVDGTGVAVGLNSVNAAGGSFGHPSSSFASVAGAGGRGFGVSSAFGLGGSGFTEPVLSGRALTQPGSAFASDRAVGDAFGGPSSFGQVNSVNVPSATAGSAFGGVVSAFGSAQSSGGGGSSQQGGGNAFGGVGASGAGSASVFSNASSTFQSSSFSTLAGNYKAVPQFKSVFGPH
ncbi:putative surface antigen 2 (CA-2) [Trypanosoma rangeli]|uniref:Putative surface antigen 2 (CA-2) n=1 Tax=Trypanosoma rangeli TaxID=5698 RepID=A0A3R7KAN0_TRYRA|nr:putative surface antigen 2 (CA-2) [Trypanosoma rangeli]RNF04417.1 putative surface antigen 2 (CA-2) [Trypanosoma rangeli]|eukprot:RNF04417.1 putative surface antigen 2 (CA-2) [Trypanosoma rangeli]